MSRRIRTSVRTLVCMAKNLMAGIKNVLANIVGVFITDVVVPQSIPDKTDASVLRNSQPRQFQNGISDSYVHLARTLRRTHVFGIPSPAVPLKQVCISATQVIYSHITH